MGKPNVGTLVGANVGLSVGDMVGKCVVGALLGACELGSRVGIAVVGACEAIVGWRVVGSSEGRSVATIVGAFEPHKSVLFTKYLIVQNFLAGVPWLGRTLCAGFQFTAMGQTTAFKVMGSTLAAALVCTNPA